MSDTNSTSIVAALQQLSNKLQSLDNTSTATSASKNNDDDDGDCSTGKNDQRNLGVVVLSHYRNLPPAVTEAYALLHTGAALLHATSTKCGLLAKLRMDSATADGGGGGASSTELQQHHALLQGCQLVTTACVALHSDDRTKNDSMGCSRSARKHVRHAARAVVRSVLLLVEQLVRGSYGEPTAASVHSADNLTIAQAVGAVWQACDYVLQKKLPLGNRAAMKRDLLTYMRECEDSREEFQKMVDVGPAAAAPPPTSDGEELARTSRETKLGVDDDDDPWDMFSGGQQRDQYTALELPVATACVGILRCSRGTLRVSLQAMEAVGLSPEVIDSNSSNDVDSNEPKQARLGWIAELHDRATAVGVGVTDLGATLYPPLELFVKEEDDGSFQEQVTRQSDAVEAALEWIVDCNFDLPQDVLELTSKIQTSIATWRTEAINATSLMTANTEGGAMAEE
jgi:Grap2 and cyclin-D-interacting